MKLEYDKTKLQEAVSAAAKVRENAYTPYSQFKVGAAIVSEITGRIYGGCNVENASYGATICAERNAVLQAVAAEGAPAFSFLVVYTDTAEPVPPCAMCLQVLAEFCSPEMPVYLCTASGVQRRCVFRDLLPRPFNAIPMD